MRCSYKNLNGPIELGKSSAIKSAINTYEHMLSFMAVTELNGIPISDIGYQLCYCSVQFVHNPNKLMPRRQTK